MSSIDLYENKDFIKIFDVATDGIWTRNCCGVPVSYAEVCDKSICRYCYHIKMSLASYSDRGYWTTYRLPREGETGLFNIVAALYSYGKITIFNKVGLSSQIKDLSEESVRAYNLNHPESRIYDCKSFSWSLDQENRVRSEILQMVSGDRVIYGSSNGYLNTEHLDLLEREGLLKQFVLITTLQNRNKIGQLAEAIGDIADKMNNAGHCLSF